MHNVKKFWIAFLIILFGTGCNYLQPPVRVPQVDDKLIINASIPQKVERGKEFEFIVITEMDSSCFSGIKYLTIQNEWKTVDLPEKISDENGKCIWIWEVPIDAKNGMAEFRAYARKDEKTGYTLPDDFCINICQ